MSIYELDHLINESINNNKEEDAEMELALNRLLLIKHRKFRNVFSKIKLD